MYYIILYYFSINESQTKNVLSFLQEGEVQYLPVTNDGFLKLRNKFRHTQFQSPR